MTNNPETKEPVATYVERFDQLVGRIVNMERYKREFESGGKSSGFNITIMAGKNKGMLQLKWVEPVLKRFLKVAENIDFNKRIRISVFSTKLQSGKTGTGVSFKQDNGNPDPEQWDKVEEFYHKDHPEMPKAVHNDFDDSYDYTAQNYFLGQRFMERVYPRIQAIAKEHGLLKDQQPAQQAPAQQQPAPAPQQAQMTQQLAQHPAAPPVQQQQQAPPPAQMFAPQPQVNQVVPQQQQAPPVQQQQQDPNMLAQARETYNQQQPAAQNDDDFMDSFAPMPPVKDEDIPF